MIYFCKAEKSHKMTDVASNLHNIVLKIKRNMPNIIDTGQNLTKLLQKYGNHFFGHRAHVLR